MSKPRIKILAYEDEKGKWNLKTIPDKYYLNEEMYQDQELMENVIIDIGEFLCVYYLQDHDIEIYLRKNGEDINV